MPGVVRVLFTGILLCDELKSHPSCLAFHRPEDLQHSRRSRAQGVASGGSALAPQAEERPPRLPFPYLGYQSIKPAAT